jgi:ribosome-associated toxin RatA of RatAB toxin-antitoxin module
MRDDSYMEAELEVGFKVFVERYTSQITLEKNKLVLTKVADSTLFNSLDNRWEFAPGPTPTSCWLSFSVDFAFKSPLYGQLATVFFKEVVQQMMGAFEGQCKRQFGPSTFNAQQHAQRRAASA